MKSHSRTAWILAAALFAAAPLRAAIDTAKIADHVHKRYSTPRNLKITIKDLGPSPIPGFRSGKIHFKTKKGAA